MPSQRITVIDGNMVGVGHVKRHKVTCIAEVSSQTRSSFPIQAQQRPIA